MEKAMIICTEKTGRESHLLFDQVLASLHGQQLDEIIVVHNRQKAQCVQGVTNLFFKKTQQYEVASCFNLALDYCEMNYADDFILLTIDDDCIAQSEYVFHMTEQLEHKQVHQPMLMYHQWPLPQGFRESFTSQSWLHRPVTSLVSAIERKSELGSEMQLFGLRALIWDSALRGLRFDEHYNGHWGMEDTDFCFQLLEKGFSIQNQEKSCVWHCLTNWKTENHSDTHTDRMSNPNYDYFVKKWLTPPAAS